MNNTIFIVLAILFIIYLAILVSNKRGNKKRKSRNFMEGKRRHQE
ncbi:hypothetical protein [Croceivirga lutea]|nr:hypothetical protein [Croceivirga lutea]